MMVRIAGVVLPPQKHVRVALQAVYGVGNVRAMAICKKVGVETTTKV